MMKIYEDKNEKIFKEKSSEWVRENIGAEYVNDFMSKCRIINHGHLIGGYEKTEIFLHIVDHMKKDTGLT